MLGSILAPVVGGLLGGLGGGNSSASTQQSNLAPWQVPYVQQGLNAARQVFQAGPQAPYPNSGVAPLSQTTTNAIQGIADPTNVNAYGQIRNYALGQATAGNNMQTPMVGASNVGEQQYITNSLNGAYLNSNPYIDRTYEQAARGVQAGYDSQFASGGRLKSGAAARALAGGLGDLATNVYGQNYQQERDRQQQAAGMAINRSGQINQIAQGNQNAFLNNQQFGMNYGMNAANTALGAQDRIMDAYGQQMGAGNVLDQYGQSLVNDQRQRYAQNQAAPWQHIQNYLGVVGGPYGNSSQTNQPGNMWSNILGGAQLGAGIFGALGGG